MEYAIVDGIEVHIDSVPRGEIGICPVCGDEMLAKKGSVKKYFAHKINTGSDCALKYKQSKAKVRLDILDKEERIKTNEGLFDNYYDNIYNDVESIEGDTDEQLAIVNSTEKRVLVNSNPGSGKSYTLEQYIKAHPEEEILYLVFNKSARDDFEKRCTSDNVQVRTIHSYAFREFGVKYKDKLRKNLNAYDIGRGIGKFLKTAEDFEYADDLLLLWEKFQLSEFHTIIDFLKYEKSTRFKSDMEKLYRNSYNKKINITHSFYYKLWHLSNPKFEGFDTLLIDEINDINGALVDIMQNNKTLDKIVGVGDPKQNIMSFAHSVNAFDKLKGWKEYPLTSSFRFGNSLSKLIEKSFNKYFEKEFTMIGVNNSQKLVKKVDENKKHYKLFRYNGTIIKDVLEKTIDGKKVFIDKGRVGINFGLIKKVLDFYNGNIKILDFKKFEDYEHLIKYSKKINDYDILMCDKLIMSYGLDLKDMIDRAEKNIVSKMDDADIVYCTGHSSKGKTIDLPLIIGGDFPDMTKNLEGMDIVTERNLLFVAYTRARNEVEIGHQLKLMYEIQ